MKISIIATILAITATALVGTASVHAGCCVNGSSCSYAADVAACPPPGSFSSADCASLTACNQAQPVDGIYIPDNTGLPDPPNGIRDILGYILNWMLAIIAIVAVIAFVVTGFQYLTAMGNEEEAEVAKRNMTYSVIGLAVALLGMAVVYTIDAILNDTFFFG